MSTAELKHLLLTGAQLFQQQHFEEAAQIFQHATELAPGSVVAWCNLAAAYIESRKFEQALAAADRAIALNPHFAAAHVNRGDALRLGKHPITLWRDAYRRAVELQPQTPSFLNKLAITLQTLGELNEAGNFFAQALTHAPDFRLARLNLGSLLVLQGRSDRAHLLVLEGLALPGVSETERQELADALKIMDENIALAPALQRALEKRSPEDLLSEAGLKMQGTQHYDTKLVACVANCLRRMPANAKPHSPIDTKPDPISDMLEAHFSAHLGDNATAASGTVEFLRTYGGVPRNDIPHPVGGKLLDAHNYFNAIQHFRAVSKSHACDVRKSVSWLRYWHAFLSSHRQELAPGQLKAFPNNVIINNVERTAPGLVQGTLEHIYANYYALLPPCAPRAALAYYIIADIHPFPDGNGRLGRFLMNRELQAAGLRPVVTPANLKPPFGRALNAIRQQFDLRPFVEWLTSCDEYTRGISDELINY